MIDGLILAFQFFTRLPFKKNIDFNEKNIRTSIIFYPLVGAVIGLLAALIYYPLSYVNKNIASLGALFILILVTGGLHLDGLSDTFDGFLSNRDKERVLEIMKDSRIGAFGVISIIMLVLSKYVIISSFDSGFELAVILSLANSRLVVSRIISSKRVAREGGLGSLFHQSNPGKNIIFSIVFYLVILLFINHYFIIPLIINFIVAELFCNWSYKKIDGMTGDTYGAIIEVGDTVSLLIFWGLIEWIL